MPRPRFELAPLSDLAPHALAPAKGETLVLWPASDRWRLPAAVSSATHWGTDAAAARTYDTVVSVGQLGTAPDVEHLLDELRPVMTSDSVLLFCEPTIASDVPTTEPPHDVTTALWRAGWTPFEVRRDRRRSGLRHAEYCWGRARLTPEYAPPRRWADSR